MDGVCGTYEMEYKCMQSFDGEHRRERSLKTWS